MMKPIIISLILALLLAACAPSRSPVTPPASSEATTTTPASRPADTTSAAPVTTTPITDPPQTNPPQTNPHQTEPPQTTAPVTTEPPATTPPVTMPPVTTPPETTQPSIVPPPTSDPVDKNPPESYPDRYAWVDYDIESTYFGTVLPEGDKADETYLNQIVFLGDSTTYGLRYYGILPGGKQTGNVWVPKNGTLTLNNVPDAKIYLHDTNREMTVSEALVARKPTILVITLGVNGIGWMSRDVFLGEYRELIEAVRTLSPDTVILLQSIFPVRPEWEKQESINNKKISQANDWIAALAQEYGLGYLNTAEECLLNEYGYLKYGYDSGDGLHLMPDVYRRIVDYILRHPIFIITDPTV